MYWSIRNVTILLPRIHATRTNESHMSKIVIMSELNDLLEDFKGQNSTFVTTWLEKNGLIKLYTAVFESFEKGNNCLQRW